MAPTTKQATSRNYTVLIPQLTLPWISSATSAVIAYAIRQWGFKYRFIAGCGTLQLFAKITEIANDASKSTLPESPKCTRLLWTAFGLLSVSFSGYFGGNLYYKKHGIDSYRKAIVNSLCSGQAYFRKNEGARKKALKNLCKFAGYSCAAYCVSKIIKSGLVPLKFIQSNIVLHMEALMLMQSFAVLSFNIPANLYYLIFGGNDDIEVIEPYAFVYFQPSIRDFWKSWSRPAGELYRWMVYEPLGGRNRFWLSVPALFATNCFVHYDVWDRMYGNKAMKETNKAFAVMGSAMILYMLTENIFLKKKKRDNAIMDASQLKSVDNEPDVKDANVENSVYWKIWSFGLFHASMAATLYLLKDKPMQLDLEKICDENIAMFEGIDVKI